MGLENIFGNELAEDIKRHRDAVIKEMQTEDTKPADQPQKKDKTIEDLGGGLTRDIERGKKMVAKDMRLEAKSKE